MQNFNVKYYLLCDLPFFNCVWCKSLFRKNFGFWHSGSYIVDNLKLYSSYNSALSVRSRLSKRFNIDKKYIRVVAIV